MESAQIRTGVGYVRASVPTRGMSLVSRGIFEESFDSANMSHRALQLATSITGDWMDGWTT